MCHFNIVTRVTALELESCLPHVVHSKMKSHHLRLSQIKNTLRGQIENCNHSLCQGTYLRPKIRSPASMGLATSEYPKIITINGLMHSGQWKGSRA